MSIYYKATRTDGMSFHGDPPVSYTRKDGTPRTSVIRPAQTDEAPTLCGPGVLHVSDVPTETLIGCSWPCRLFEVEPVGELIGREGHKFGFEGLRIVREVEAWRALGPQGREIVALIERVGRLTDSETTQLTAAWAAAWDAARDAAWYAARAAARDAARDAARYATRVAAWDAAWALVVRDLIGQHGFTQERYDALTGPLASAIGPIHPDDA